LKKPSSYRSAQLPDWLSALLPIIQEQVGYLEKLLGTLTAAQVTVPGPESKDLQEMRAGTRSITPEAYVLGVLQEAIVSIETTTEDLRVVLDYQSLATMPLLKNLSAIQLNAIEAAVAARS
jgi:hypothetical protein